MRKTVVTVMAMIFILLFSGVAYAAQAPPAFPAIYQGTVQGSDGNPISSGTVKAFIDGDQKGEGEFTNGSYELAVNGDASVDGKQVTFKVQMEGFEYTASPAPNPVAWHEEEEKTVNLTVDLNSGTPESGEQTGGESSSQTGAETGQQSENQQSQQNSETVNKTIKLTVGKVDATINGNPYTLDCEPYVNDQAQRTLVPLRFISEALGAKVDWDAKTSRITITDIKKVILTIGSTEVMIDGKSTTIDCAPVVQPPGRTFVPIRFVSETLGAQVDYDGTTKEITISR